MLIHAKGTTVAVRTIAQDLTGNITAVVVQALNWMPTDTPVQV